MPATSQDPEHPRGKIHRINPDGTIPTDNPFYDGAGPNVDSIWALGLRNPYRAFYDAPTGRMYIGDVGGNDYSTASRRSTSASPGANYGWPNIEGPCPAPCKSPLYSYPHNGRDSAVTGGFVYHGTQFPASYQGSYFFADYTQNWIRRLTFDANGNLERRLQLRAGRRLRRRPLWRHRVPHRRSGRRAVLRRPRLLGHRRHVRRQQDPPDPLRLGEPGRRSPSRRRNPTSGPAPLVVNFSSAGSLGSGRPPLTYAWTSVTATTSTAANPVHTYAQAGPVHRSAHGLGRREHDASRRRSRSAPAIRRRATILSPTDGVFFRAGDVISFSGDGTDPEDGTLPASAHTPGTSTSCTRATSTPAPRITGVKSGTFTIPTTGHDFSGNTRYRITLTVTDSSGLTTSTFVTIWPQKVNLTFNTAPPGLTLYLDGIAKTTPFVYDTLVGFNHTIEARNQIVWTPPLHVRLVVGWRRADSTSSSSRRPPRPTPPRTRPRRSSPTPVFVQAGAATPQRNHDDGPRHLHRVTGGG